MLEILFYDKLKNEIKSAQLDEIQSIINNENYLIWIDMENIPEVPPENADLRLLKDIIGVHPLILEDCISSKHPPKIEEFPDYIFVILNKLGIDSAKCIKTSQVNFIIGSNYLVTYRHEKIEEIENVKNSFRLKVNHIHKSSITLFYAIADHIIDNYAYALDNFDTRIDLIEEKLFKNQNISRILQWLSRIRDNLVRAKRIVIAENEVFYNLTRGFYGLIKEEEKIYFRDIYDHLGKDAARIDSQRESIANILDLQMNLNSQKLNEIIKFLTIVSTVFIPLNLIAGIFGMNFSKMPLLNTSYGFSATIGVMILIVCLLIYYFKKQKWI